jgi:hypothetical protein
MCHLRRQVQEVSTLYDVKDRMRHFNHPTTHLTTIIIFPVARFTHIMALRLHEAKLPYYLYYIHKVFSSLLIFSCPYAYLKKISIPLTFIHMQELTNNKTKFAK